MSRCWINWLMRAKCPRAAAACCAMMLAAVGAEGKGEERMETIETKRLRVEIDVETATWSVAYKPNACRLRSVTAALCIESPSMPCPSWWQ